MKLPYLKKCCCCVIPLRIGCFIIGGLEILLWASYTLLDLKLLSEMYPEPNEDEENRNQRRTVRLIYIFHSLRCLVFVLLGAFIIIFTTYRLSRFLKYTALVEILILVLHVVILLVSPQNSIAGRYFAPYVLLAVWRLYIAAVLISYAHHLEDKKQRQSSDPPTQDESPPKAHKKNENV